MKRFAILFSLVTALVFAQNQPNPQPSAAYIIAPAPFAAPAGWIPLPADTVFKGVQQNNLNALFAEYTVINQQLIASAAGSCSFWTQQNLLLRAAGSPKYPTPKTLPQNLWEYSLETDPGTGTVWISPPTQSGPIAGQPCADLPPLPAAGSVLDIGSRLVAYGSVAYYACPADDNNPGGTIVIVTPGETFPSKAVVAPGVYQKTFLAFGYYWLTPPLPPAPQ